MQTHSRRRKAFGLAALSLGATGAVFGQAEGAPGTAKEPRPASHFRLVLQGVESKHVKNGSLVLKDFKKRQVFSYRAGRRLAGQLPGLSARINDTYTKAQADAAFLTKAGAGVLMSKEEANQTFLTQSAAAPFLTEAEADAFFLTPAEADAVYAKKGEGVPGASKLVAFGGEGAKIIDIPGVGELRAFTGASSNTFTVLTASQTPIAINVSDGSAGTTTAVNPYTTQIIPGDVITMQMVAPDGQIVTLILSAGQGDSPRRMTAQILTTP